MRTDEGEKLARFVRDGTALRDVIAALTVERCAGGLGSDGDEDVIGAVYRPMLDDPVRCVAAVVASVRLLHELVRDDPTIGMWIDAVAAASAAGPTVG